MTAAIADAPFATLQARFVDALQRATDGLIDAAKIVVSADPETRERLREANPKVSSVMWRRLEALGHGNLDARLITQSFAASHAVARLPKPAQTAVLDHGVEMLTENGDVLRVAVDNLSYHQARQVFAYDHVRRPEEQRAWREAQPATVAVPPTKAWTVRAGKVRFSSAVELSRLDLIRILEELG